MISYSKLRTRVRQAWRAAWPVLVVAGAAVTCDNPMAPKPVAINVVPVIDLGAIREFAGMSVDNARITVLRPPADTLGDRIFPFSVDSTQLDVSMAVSVAGTESLTVNFQLLSGTTVMFTGSQVVVASAGLETPPQTTITPSFVGPGSSIKTIQILPRDSGTIFGGSFAFRVVAFDSSNNQVASFYTGWSPVSAPHSTNAGGMFTAGNQRGVVWVHAHTPTGIEDSTRVYISPVPSQLQVVSGANQSAPIGTQLSQQLVARVIAADNLPVVGVPVTFAATGGGSVSPATVATDTSGLAKTWATLGNTTGSVSFTATVSGIPVATFSQTATAGAASKLAFTQQPTNTTAGAVISPPLTVAAQDAGGFLDQSFTGAITIAIANNAGGGTLGGTVTANAVSGVATFGDLTIDKSGTGYTLSASAATLTGATSSAFNITAAAATTITVASGNNQSGAPNSALANPLVVTATDAFGNGVPGVGVTFAVTAGGGSLGTPNATTAANGQAQTSWTLGASGTQTATATSGSLAGSPLTFSAAVSNPGTTSISPKLDTLTAIGATRQFTAQALNQAGQPYTGSFTWTSRNTGIITVNANGLATAVANGSTYLVVQDSSGTRDSAAVVVQQRIATINVSPSAKSIYLTGVFAFSATAVDGLGTPLPSQPSFTWSTTAPAVATVDASGNVSGIGLGSAQIKATSGSVTGVAAVQIITPITRIAVVVDTVGASVTDTASLASLGITRRYRAIAHDTLDAVMSGLTFTWASSNGSVAVMNTTTGDTATVTSAANGVTEVRATAQGFTSAPGAKLTVSQVLASIQLSPPASNPTATVGIGGTVAPVARGLDANGRFIAGGAFTFGTSAAAIATVDATTGVVTGVANGQADITATSGQITSNPLTVTVGGGSVPSIISFGRDTVSVGRGGTASIPILLSKPLGAPLTINLSVADTFAFWSQSSVVIPAGQTSINATLNGHNAGTTTVTAADGSGAGYATGTAVAKVTANMNLTNGSYAINATDIVQTQVLLSDPSPAGGTYVTFSYGTAGIAAISPDPAFIPAGQLAADIQIRGLAGGSTTITPVATGVNGSAANFTAYNPVLTACCTFIRLGQGQYESGVYLSTPTNSNTAVPVTLTSSDTNVITVQPSGTIPAGSYYTYFTMVAKGRGNATISFTAPGWSAANSVAVQSTTPRLGICCGGNIFTTNPATSVGVYVEDSLGSAHYRSNSLLVHLASSDTTIMKVLDTLVTVQPGSYYQSGQIIPGGLTGSAYIIATASGHAPDSTLWTVQGPPLSLSWNANRMGAGQEDQNLYVSTPNNVTQALTVTLTSSDSNVAATVPSVTIPAGSYYAYFTIRGKTPGQVTFNATAPGYNPDSATYLVTTPRLTVCCNATLNNFGGGTGMTVYSTDSTGGGHYRTTPLAVTLTALDPSVATVDSLTVTIRSGYYYNSSARITPVGVGTARFTMSASGHTSVDTITITVQTPKLNISFNSTRLGRRQSLSPNRTGFYSYVPDNRATPLVITYTQLHNTVDTLAQPADTIPAGTYYRYNDVYGLVPGQDTIIATAPGYLPDTAYVTVTTPQLTNCCMPTTTTTTNPPIGITVYAADSVGSGHYTMDTIVVAAVASDTTVIKPIQPFFVIPKGAYYASTTLAVVGPGSASMTYSDSANTGYLPTTTGTINVTGPALAIANGSTRLGMRQHGGTNSSYVYVPNNVGTPLTVNLVSTDPRVATVPAQVTIPAGSYYAYFDITAQDTVGTIQIQATATGYSAAASNVQVTIPTFVISSSSNARTTSGAQSMTVYAADASGTAHYTTEDVVVTLLSSAPGVAAIDSSTVTILTDTYYSNTAHWTPGTIGTAQLSATDGRSALYAYGQATFNVSVTTPVASLGLTSALGIGQYEDYQGVYLPDYQASATTVTLTHLNTARTQTYDNLTTTANSTFTVAQGSYYQYFRIAGVSAGPDSIMVSVASPLHTPDTAVIAIGQGRLDPGSWPSSVKAGDSVAVTFYTRDQNQNGHPVLNNETITFTVNANLEVHQGTTVITSATPGTLQVPAGASSITVYLVGVNANTTASLAVSNTNYATYSNTVNITP